MVIVTLTLIISFFTWRTQRSEHRISRIKYGKEWAKGRLIMLKNELQDIADQPDYEGKFRDKNSGLWRVAKVARELGEISDLLIQVGLIVPGRLFDMIREKDFFENTAKLQKAINQIETLLRELG